MAKIKVDFTGVESFISVTEGEHIVKLISIEEGTTQNGDDKLSAKFEVTKGECIGGRIFETFTLNPKALWKFKSFLEAISVKADGKVLINTDNLIGKTCIINVALEDYNGKNSPKIQGFKKLATKVIEDTVSDDEEDFDDDGEDETPPAPAPVKAKKEEKKAPPAPKKEEPKKKATVPVVEEDDFDDDSDDEDWED